MIGEEANLDIKYRRLTERDLDTTLFSYMSGVQKPRLAFVRELREGAEKYFPDFRKNPYYLANTGEEEQELIAMQAQSDKKFYWYYLAKLKVRNFRRKAANGNVKMEKISTKA